EEAPPTSTGDSSTAQPPEGVKASPVAARVAAAEGVDLARVSGSGPAGRITKSDVLSASSGAPPASGNGAPAAAGAPPNGRTCAPAEPSAQAMRGGAVALARYMEG